MWRSLVGLFTAEVADPGKPVLSWRAPWDKQTEILVYVLPVLLGDGIRFSSPGLARIDLEPLSSARSGDATILRFRVRKESDQADG